jgi:ATP-dependent Clp protease ATP-binding subunit ClpA
MNRKEHLAGLEEFLRARVIGQDDAISCVSRALEASECHLNDTGPRPRGAFLFMGPSGVGKTETCKAFNEYLFGNDRLTMVFCNEYQSPSDVSDFVQAIKRGVAAHPSGTVILLDEIEKAHRSIIDILLSLLDEGKVSDADGSRILVGNCYITLTSNIGAARWSQMEQTKYSVMQNFAFESARKILRPELFNRLTEHVVYRPLSQETQIAILQSALEAKLVHLDLKLNLGKLSIDPRVNAHLLRKCFTQAGGARRLKQELDRQINLAVLPWAMTGTKPTEGVFFYDAAKDRLQLR